MKENVSGCFFSEHSVVKTTKEEETDSTGQTNRQDERVRMQINKKFKTTHYSKNVNKFYLRSVTKFDL